MHTRHPSRLPSRLVMTATLAAAGMARAQWATFELIPGLSSNPLDSPLIYAITPDGSKAVGFSQTDVAGEEMACLWTRGVGTVALGDLNTTRIRSRAYAISDDGTVIAGKGSNELAHRSRAFRWTAANGMIELPLPAALGQDASSFGYGMTPDGNMIVG